MTQITRLATPIRLGLQSFRGTWQRLNMMLVTGYRIDRRIEPKWIEEAKKNGKLIEL